MISGDATATSAGVLTLGTGAVTSTKILDDTITNADINSAAAIAYSKLNLSNSIVAGDLTSNAVTTAKIANNAVDGTKIALGSDTVGDTMYYNGTDWVRLGIGSAGQFLQVNGGATAPQWATGSTTNVYNTNGTLSAARTITSGGFSLTYDGTGDIIFNDSGSLTSVGLTSTGTFSQTGSSTFAGSISQSGANTFSTGTGSVSLNGNTSVTGTNTFTVGTGATTLGGTLAVTGNQTNTGDIAVNGGDITTTASTFNLINGTATTVNFAGAATTINLGAAGAVVTGGGALTLASASATALTLDSGTTGALNIGTGANAKTITIGNLTGATALNLNVGSAGLSVTGTGANTVALATYSNSVGNYQSFISGSTPESAVTGSIGDTTYDVVNGEVYIKKTGTATNTGWQRIMTATG